MAKCLSNAFVAASRPPNRPISRHHLQGDDERGGCEEFPQGQQTKQAANHADVAKKR
jgi:hypothetical protein